MKLPIITKSRSINCSIYSAYIAIFNLFFSWVPMCILIGIFPIYGVLIMTKLIIYSLISLILSLTVFLPIEAAMIARHKIKALEVNITKKQGIIIICLAILLLLISMRFWYGFWILGIVKNPNLD